MYAGSQAGNKRNGLECMPEGEDHRVLTSFETTLDAERAAEVVQVIGLDPAGGDDGLVTHGPERRHCPKNRIALWRLAELHGLRFAGGRKGREQGVAIRPATAAADGV